MKFKRQEKTTKKSNLPAVMGMDYPLWNEFKKIAQDCVSKAELVRVFGQINAGFNTLLKGEFPGVKVYLKRAQRKIDRFFIRQNRLSISKNSSRTVRDPV